ncbi:hypothetical protein [Lysinibacillus sp. RS5]|uniref:hypothetical protein n=1 Tax=unclassified Lysinibacillus TaxID=2636778 RepID=UPI0035BE2203
MRKRSVSGRCFLCESAAAAADVFCAKAQQQQHGFVCAKAKRQQHGFCLCESAASATWFLPVRKRSVSNMVLSVRKRSEAKRSEAKRQQHDVGHSGVFTGCEALSLSSSISADVFCTESVATGTDVWTPAKIS